jgi:predicted Rossmann-fold nucleotide-binding protein
MNFGQADGTGQQQQAKVPHAAFPVIAVFGGADDSPTLEMVEQVGYEIGRSHAILLTGGDDPNAPDLKGHVLAGACRARRSGAKAPWIGVVRAETASDPKSAAGGLSVVLTLGGDHLRNYAEAELCDAAIAFEGGSGTSSEVVFCLALRKPLVLIGNQWLSKYPVESEDNARAKLRKEAQKRVPPSPEHPRLGPPIISTYEKLDQVVEPSISISHCRPRHWRALW